MKDRQFLFLSQLTTSLSVLLEGAAEAAAEKRRCNNPIQGNGKSREQMVGLMQLFQVQKPGACRACWGGVKLVGQTGARESNRSCLVLCLRRAGPARDERGFNGSNG